MTSKAAPTVAAVIFDLFDTLVDLPMDALPRIEIGGRQIPSTAGALYETLRQRHDIPFERFVEALRGVDRTWRERAYREGRELPTIERFARVARALDLDDPELSTLLTRVHMQMLEGVARFLPHHPETLAALRRLARIGLCSNFSHTPTALSVLERAGLQSHLDAVVVSHDLGIRKPRPEIFTAALAALDVGADRAIHVGDNLDADVSGAAAVGLRTVWITRRVPDPTATLARHKGPAPTWIVNDLDEIQAILEKISKE